MMYKVMYTIFLNLHNPFDTLDRGIFLDILEGYGLGPRARHILHVYWDRISMVARMSGYNTVEFQGFWGVTQGDPLPPTIFNVVLDAVMHH